MKGKKIHIISFDNPYPPNYGGIIDVFYKIKYFKEKEYDIILHIYADDLEIDPVLDNLCEKIYSYARKKQFYYHFSILPFIVKSRFDKKMLSNLKKDRYPILFEGLHTTLPVLKGYFSDRKIYLRTHNIEHNYYKGLAKSERNYIKKGVFYFEAYKLKRYEKNIISNFDIIFTISNFENVYFSKNYTVKTVLWPIFHQNKSVVTLSETGKYALYQGDLRVSDNKKVVSKLIELFTDINYHLVIAGNLTKPHFDKLFKIQTQNITYQKINDNKHLLQLFANAHINVLFSYQNTGTKLKLINALYNSRFCLINDNMVDDEEVKKCCVVENDLSKYKAIIIAISSQKYNMNSTKSLQLNTLETTKEYVINTMF